MFKFENNNNIFSPNEWDCQISLLQRMGSNESAQVCNAFPTDVWIKVDAEKVTVSCQFFMDIYSLLILRRRTLR